MTANQGITRKPEKLVKRAQRSAAHLLVALDEQRHLALGHADGAEADEIRVLDDLEIGRALLPLAGDGRRVGGGSGAVAAVEQAAEAVHDRAPSAHPPSPALPTALAASRPL